MPVPEVVPFPCKRRLLTWRRHMIKIYLGAANMGDVDEMDVDRWNGFVSDDRRGRRVRGRHGTWTSSSPGRKWRDDAIEGATEEQVEAIRQFLSVDGKVLRRGVETDALAKEAALGEKGRRSMATKCKAWRTGSQGLRRDGERPRRREDHRVGVGFVAVRGRRRGRRVRRPVRRRKASLCSASRGRRQGEAVRRRADAVLLEKRCARTQTASTARASASGWSRR